MCARAFVSFSVSAFKIKYFWSLTVNFNFSSPLFFCVFTSLWSSVGENPDHYSISWSIELSFTNVSDLSTMTPICDHVKRVVRMTFYLFKQYHIYNFEHNLAPF